MRAQRREGFVVGAVTQVRHDTGHDASRSVHRDVGLVASIADLLSGALAVRLYDLALALVDDARFGVARRLALILPIAVFGVVHIRLRVHAVQHLQLPAAQAMGPSLSDQVVKEALQSLPAFPC